MKKLLLVEDSPVVIVGIKYILKNFGLGEMEIDIARSFTEMSALLNKEDYQIAIIGVYLAEVQLSSLLKMIKQSSSTAILLFTDKVESLPAKQLYQHGLCGIIDKTESTDEILYAIKQAASGQIYVSQSLLQQFLKSSSVHNHNPNSAFNVLTAREKEIARLLAQGSKNSQISKELALQPSTVSTFKTRIFSKLNVHNIIELKQARQSFSA